MKIIRPLAVTDTIFTACSLAENDYAAYASGTTYATGNRCILTSTHRIYESLKDANTGHNPPDNLAGDDPWWKEVSSTNKWKMFDAKTGSASVETAETLTVELTVAEMVDSMALLNFSATDITVSMVSGGETVYSHTEDCIRTDTIGDWYDYFFESFEYITDLALTDLPPYGSSVLTIALTKTGGAPSLGELVVGRQRDIGRDQYGASAGITDYSRKEADEQGYYSIEERSYSKTISTVLTIYTPMVDQVATLMAQYRATTLVWVGDGGYRAMLAYGFVRDFSCVVAGVMYSTCSLEIEGLG